MATILSPNGLLKYGDLHESIIWQAPCTSEASIATPLIGGGGTYSKVGTTQLFDPVKGFLAGANGSYRVRTIPGYEKLNSSGQVCFDIETAMLACSGADSEGSSGGRAQTGSETLLGFLYNPASGGNHQWFIAMSDKYLNLNVGYGSNTTSLYVRISDVIGKGPFTTIHVAWSGGYYYLFVNELLVGRLQKLDNNTLTGYELVLGTYPFTPAIPLISGYIRNVQVSYRGYSFSGHPVLSKVQVFGDSFAEDTYGMQTPTWDMAKSLNMEQEFIKIGMTFGSFDVRSYGGRTVIGTGSPTTRLLDNVATAVAQRPTCVVFQGGANDLTDTGTLSVALFTEYMKLIIERFFGLNGNPATTVQRMLLCSTPWPSEFPSVAAALLRKPDITTINIIQASLPAWFNTTYPTLTGRLGYQDTFADFGGFNPDKAYYGVGDKLHPIWKGTHVMGKSWAAGVLKLLRL